MTKLKIVQKEQTEDVVELWLEQVDNGDVLVKSRKGAVVLTEARFFCNNLRKFSYGGTNFSNIK